MLHLWAAEQPGNLNGFARHLRKCTEDYLFAPCFTSEEGASNFATVIIFTMSAMSPIYC